MKRSFFIITFAVFFFFLLFVNNQVNIKIKYYEISRRQEMVHQLKNHHKKLLLEYYSLFDLSEVEDSAQKQPFKMNFNGSNRNMELKK